MSGSFRASKLLLLLSIYSGRDAHILPPFPHNPSYHVMQMQTPNSKSRIQTLLLIPRKFQKSWVTLPARGMIVR